jgi:hypothetical protein
MAKTAYARDSEARIKLEVLIQEVPQYSKFLATPITPQLIDLICMEVHTFWRLDPRILIDVCPDRARHLVRHRHDGHILRPAFDHFGQPFGRRFTSGKHPASPLDQKRAKIIIAGLADVK